MSQIERSGSYFLDARLMPQHKSIIRRMASVLVLSFCLLLIGSCNERASFLDFSSSKPELSTLDKGDLLRYAYAVQASLMNTPQNIEKLRTADIQLALSKPDMERRDGITRVWQYRTKSCVLDVYWREGKPQNNITHHEFRARQKLSPGVAMQKEEPEKWACIQNIIEEHRAEVEKTFYETYAVLSLNAHKS